MALLLFEIWESSLKLNRLIRKFDPNYDDLDRPAEAAPVLSVERPSLPLLLSVFLTAAVTLILGIVPGNVLHAAQSAAQTMTSVQSAAPASPSAPSPIAAVTTNPQP